MTPKQHIIEALRGTPHERAYDSVRLLLGDALVALEVAQDEQQVEDEMEWEAVRGIAPPEY